MPASIGQVNRVGCRPVNQASILLACLSPPSYMVEVCLGIGSPVALRMTTIHNMATHSSSPANSIISVLSTCLATTHTVGINISLRIETAHRYDLGHNEQLSRKKGGHNTLPGSTDMAMRRGTGASPDGCQGDN